MSEIYCESIRILEGDFNTLREDLSGIRVFKIDLCSFYKLVPKFLKYLNPVELQRAQNYHFEKDSNQFIICRTLLKFTIANHTGLNIETINIEVDTNKKPYICSNPEIYFNVSHSHEFAVIALSNRPVGIDMEYLNTNFDFSEILPSVFNKQEIEVVLNAKNKTFAFYKFWTRKEAIVKATGRGISDHLIQIPAMDGPHSVASKLLDGFEKLQVISFILDDRYMVSIALSEENSNLEPLLIYNLPNTLQKLITFSS